MSGSAEEVVGELWVSSKLRFGSERIRLLVTSNRIIVDHAAKKGPGAVAGTSILGELSGGLEGLFKRGSDSMKKRKIGDMSPDQVLQAHKDNFAISNGEVVHVTVEKTEKINNLTILTTDDKYEFLTQTLFDNVVAIFSKTLGDKLTIHRMTRQDLRR